MANHSDSNHMHTHTSSSHALKSNIQGCFYFSLSHKIYRLFLYSTLHATNNISSSLNLDMLIFVYSCFCKFMPFISQFACIWSSWSTHYYILTEIGYILVVKLHHKTKWELVQDTTLLQPLQVKHIFSVNESI